MKIAFMHIPKTGGISVERAIKKAMNTSSICETYFPEEYQGKLYSDMPDYDFYMGHFTIDFLKSVPDDYLKITVLRKPDDLLISLCNHISSRPKHALHEMAQSATLSELLTNKGLHNLLAKYLLGKQYQEIIVSNGKRKDKIESALKIAQSNINDFDIVGVTTKLNQFMRDVKAASQMKFTALKKENQNPSVRFIKEELSEKDLESIKSATWLDRPLFTMFNKTHKR